MEKKMKIIALIGIVTLLLIRCGKDEIALYDEYPSVYFNGSSVTYSFIEKPDAMEDTVKLPVLITGLPAETDRIFKIAVVTDTNTTATPEQYELLDGTVKAHEYIGNVAVVLRNYSFLDSTELKVKVKVVDSEDFKAGFVQSMYYIIHWTAQLQPPSNWNYLKTYFGEYSTRYYKFIIAATGRSSFPYRIINPETGEYYWKTTAEVEAYSFIIRDSLDKYNADKSHPVLMHDDGKKAGEPVEIPTY